MRMLLQFQKDASVRHLGLLDLQRTMQRALRRSGLPISYSKGYSPHINMSFASALSVGVPGQCEILDVALTQDVTEEMCLESMNRVLPQALRASRVRLIDDKHPAMMSLLKQAAYLIVLEGKAAPALCAAIPAFLAQREILAMRKTKSGEKQVDIRPMIHELTVVEAGAERALLSARVSFEERATCKPDVLMRALSEFAKVELPQVRMIRTGLFGERDGEIVPLIEL
jgi:radical SAM-linked protein